MCAGLHFGALRPRISSGSNEYSLKKCGANATDEDAGAKTGPFIGL